jgi:hypothetical protein
MPLSKRSGQNDISLQCGSAHSEGIALDAALDQSKLARHGPWFDFHFQKSR